MEWGRFANDATYTCLHALKTCYNNNAATNRKKIAAPSSNDDEKEYIRKRLTTLVCAQAGLPFKNNEQ